MDIELTTEFPLDPTTIPDRAEPPVGRVDFEIRELKKKFTAEATEPGKVGGKLIVSGTFVVKAPTQYEGIMHFQDFWIGTDTDPKGLRAETWISKATSLLKLLRRAKVNVSHGSKFEELLQAAQGQRFIGQVKIKKGRAAKDGTVYPDRRAITDFYSPGEVEVAVADETGPVTPSFTNRSTTAFSSTD